MMGIFALEPCQIYFLHLLVDFLFLVLAVSVALHTKNRRNTTLGN